MQNKEIIRRMLVLFIMCTFLWGCRENPDVRKRVHFWDTANIYSDEFKNKIIHGKYNFPQDILILIKTVDSIPVSLIGSFATLEHDNESNWAEWRDSDDVMDNGIMVLISEQPRLIQIRYGKNIFLEAYKSGFAFGNKYVFLQEAFIEQGYEAGLGGAIVALNNNLSKEFESNWLVKTGKLFAGNIYDEVSELIAPSDNAYTHYIFKPYSRILQPFLIINHPLLFVVLNAFMVYILIKVVKYLIIIFLGKSRVSLIISVIWGVFSSIFLALPLWGAVLYLSSFRLEDALYADYLGIPLLPFSTYPEWFNSITSIWFSVIIGIVVFLISIPEFFIGAYGISYLIYDSKSLALDSVFEDSDFLFSSLAKAFRLAFFSIFMPQAISVMILVYYLIKIPEATYNYLAISRLQ